MDIALKAAGKTESEIAAADSEAWQRVANQAVGVAGIEEKVNQATARAKLTAADQAEKEAQAAAQQRIAVVEASEIASIDKLKARREELSNLQPELTGDRATANANQIALLDQEIASEGIRTTLDAEHEKAAATKAGSAERIAILQKYLKDVVAQYGATSAQALSAQRELDAAMVPHKGSGGAGGAALSAARNDTRIDQEKLRQEEFELNAEVRAGRITEQQKIDQLKELTAAHYEEAIQRLSNEEAALARGSKAFQQAEQQKLLLKQQETTALAKLDDQAARAAEQAAQRSARAWEQATDPMVNSFSGALTSMMRGQSSFKDAMINMLGDILSAEIEADIKWLAHHALYSALGLKEDQKASQGGLLAMLLSQTGKTTATAAGATTRSGLEVGSSTIVNGAIATNAGIHAAGEMAKTGATAAGASARTSIDVSAAAATKAADMGTMQGGIMSHAASAAAATYDAVSQIPLIGYILAPAAAAVAFAGTAAFGSLLSFDVGAWELPHDMVAQVHKGEMIVPANFSDGLRSALGGGIGDMQSASSGDTHVHFHVSAIDGAGVKAFFKQHGRTIAATVAGQQTLNPSLRGNF